MEEVTAESNAEVDGMTVVLAPKQNLSIFVCGDTSKYRACRVVVNAGVVVDVVVVDSNTEFDMMIQVDAVLQLLWMKELELQYL